MTDAPSAANQPDDYRSACDAINHAIAKFRDCSEDERRELQSDLEALERMAEKLKAGRIEIVVFGEISTGKSALVNALVGEELTKVAGPKTFGMYPGTTLAIRCRGLSTRRSCWSTHPGLMKSRVPSEAKWLGRQPSRPIWCFL